jgi:hypothetical protein
VYDASLTKLSALTVDTLSPSGAKEGTCQFNVVRHFQKNWDKIFHMPGIYRIIALSQTQQPVYNAMLAVSASHLRHIAPGVTQHRIAEHSYQSLAFKQYRNILDAPREALSKIDLESLLISAMLLNILTFPLREDGYEREESEPWVSGSCEEWKGWLSLQSGIKPLVISTTSQIDEMRTLIGQTMFGSGGSWPTPNFKPDSGSLPHAWATIFNIEDPDDNEAFKLPIAILRELQNMQPLLLNVFRHLLFVWKMPPRFGVLLCNKDERALWLFGVWLGLLCRYEGAWWCHQRVTRNYEAICMYLGRLRLYERPGAEGKMWSELLGELELAPVFVCVQNQIH